MARSKKSNLADRLVSDSHTVSATTMRHASAGDMPGQQPSSHETAVIVSCLFRPLSCSTSSQGTHGNSQTMNESACKFTEIQLMVNWQHCLIID